MKWGDGDGYVRLKNESVGSAHLPISQFYWTMAPDAPTVDKNHRLALKMIQHPGQLAGANPRISVHVHSSLCQIP